MSIGDNGICLDELCDLCSGDPGQGDSPISVECYCYVIFTDQSLLYAFNADPIRVESKKGGEEEKPHQSSNEEDSRQRPQRGADVEGALRAFLLLAPRG